MSEQRTPPLQADNSSFGDSTPADVLRALLERAELSQRGAAKLLGIDERTVRMWCAGQGVAPASVYRALDPRLTFSEYLRRLIEENEKLVELLESGRAHELPRTYQPIDVKSSKREIERLRGRNETYQSILRSQQAMDQMQDALSVVFQQSLTPGGFGLTLDHLQAFEGAKEELQSAMAQIYPIFDQIRASHPLGAAIHKSIRPTE